MQGGCSDCISQLLWVWILNFELFCIKIPEFATFYLYDFIWITSWIWNLISSSFKVPNNSDEKQKIDRWKKLYSVYLKFSLPPTLYLPSLSLCLSFSGSEGKDHTTSCKSLDCILSSVLSSITTIFLKVFFLNKWHFLN